MSDSSSNETNLNNIINFPTTSAKDLEPDFDHPYYGLVMIYTAMHHVFVTNLQLLADIKSRYRVLRCTVHKNYGFGLTVEVKTKRAGTLLFKAFKNLKLQPAKAGNLMQIIKHNSLTCHIVRKWANEESIEQSKVIDKFGKTRSIKSRQPNRKPIATLVSKHIHRNTDKARLVLNRCTSQVAFSLSGGLFKDVTLETKLPFSCETWTILIEAKVQGGRSTKSNLRITCSTVHDLNKQTFTYRMEFIERYFELVLLEEHKRAAPYVDEMLTIDNGFEQLKQCLLKLVLAPSAYNPRWHNRLSFEEFVGNIDSELSISPYTKFGKFWWGLGYADFN